MKFTKEQLTETLKAKLTANGKKIAISEQTLKSQAEALYDLGVKEDTELDAFVTQILPTINTLEGNYRKDNSDFIKKWNEEHPQTEPKPKTEPKTDPQPTDNDSKIDKLLKEIEDIKKERDNEKLQATLANKRQSLSDKLKEKGVKDEQWLQDYLNDTSIAADTDIDAKAESALKLFNAVKSKTDDNINPNGTSTQGAKPDAHQFDDVVNLIKKERGITEK